MQDKLIKITNQLLDLGKRNRLLNYKDTGFKTLNVLNTNIDEIFRNILNKKEYNVFNIDQFLTNYRRDLGVTLEEENTSLYSDERICELTNKQLASNDILCFKKGSTLDKVLKSLNKEYNFSLIEKGINSLYLSFGFISYKEEEEEYIAPLLLIPIEINTENSFYSISLYEEEVLTNPTLKYYFSSMRDLEIPDYNNEALQTYFKKVREILPESVVLFDKISIGIYSFYKMNMYNDLIGHQDIVIKNNNIRKILDENISSVEYKEAPIYPVVNFDSTQLEAITNASMGKSFCLQGPPGSGKSQTITNIIATLLGNGKKILFVSEKIAALRVVYENLRRVGLSDFAIELHSNKTNKKDFIESIYNAATLPKYNLDFKTRALGAKYDSIKFNLEEYEEILNTKVENLDLTLQEVYSAYTEIDLKPVSIDIDYKLINTKSLSIILSILRKYEKNKDKLSYDYRKSPFYDLNIIDENFVLYGFDDAVTKSVNYLNLISKCKELLKRFFNIEVYSLNEMDKNIDIIFKMNNLSVMYPIYSLKSNRNKLLYIVENYLEQTKRLNSNKIFDIYNKDILDIDINTLIVKLNNNLNKLSLFNKELKECHSIITKYRNEKEKDEVILKELKELLKLKVAKEDISKYESTIIKNLGPINSLDFKQIIKDLKGIANLDDLKISKDNFKILKEELDLLQITEKEFNANKDGLKTLSKIINNPNYDLYSDDLDLITNRVNEMYQNKENIFLYLDNMKSLDTLKDLNNLDYLHTYLDNNYNLDYLTDNFIKLFYLNKINEAIASSRVFKNLTIDNIDQNVETFRVLDEKVLSINRDMIISNNSQHRPDKGVILEGSEFILLSKEHDKTRRQMPIRQLLDRIFNLALDVKPVFLMSPLSVSTYLASELDMFDCCIFDEASQIFASDALGSIYRAKQCIVIGDSKQMPPTAFFQVGQASDEAEEEYDLESILDKASKVFETSCLKWHYRSRSEELIDFSNKQFYEENLITIPQASTHKKGLGIDFCYVEDGIYDALSRTNPTEAKRVCDLVFEHIVQSDKSIGVVAFSNVQAELIADMVDKRLKKEPKYQQYFDKQDDEPFFVKNLENVQGDERDRIIFSICYGYNKENKFHQRFGPLNNKGGERRLNVAITRAKFNITVVSSIKPSDINTKNTDSLGVLLLKQYLEFSSDVDNNKNYSDTNNGVINKVKAYIESLGYEVFTNYGASSFKIDLAIKKGEEFFLAIMIDGKEYSNSTTDKYRLEKLLLERLGWSYFKLYTTLWVQNEEEIKAKLKDALEGKTEEIYVEEDTAKANFLKVDKSEDSIESLFKEYKELNDDLAIKYLTRYGVSELIKNIIHVEAPIHSEYLIKRVSDIAKKAEFSISKEEIENSIPVDNRLIKDYYFEDIYMNINLRFNSSREVKYVHPDELKDGIVKVVKKNNGISIDGCYKSIANLLGYSKISVNLRKLLDEQLQNVMLDRLIYEENGTLLNK